MFAARVLDQAEDKARRAGASVVRVFAACVAGLLSCGFLTAAAWHYLRVEFGAGIASLSLGAFFAVSLIGILLIKPRPIKQDPKPNIGLDDLAEAFVAAAALGRSTRRK